MAARLTEWKIEKELKTPEDRALFLEAILEDAVKDHDFGTVFSAVGAVIRSIEHKPVRGGFRRASAVPVSA